MAHIWKENFFAKKSHFCPFKDEGRMVPGLLREESEMDLKVFTNEELGSVRVMERNGEPWFVGKDVADILGYTNSRKAIGDHVDEEDKNTVTIRDGIQGNPNQTIINESGMYSLILSSKLPAAKRFKHWVTAEVLPSIRRHGVYAIDEMLANPEAMISALMAYKEEREKRLALASETAVQKQQIAELQPKANYYDIVLNCPDLLPITVIAKDYGWSGRRMNRYLADKGIQFRQGDIWLLYQQYAQRGYTSTKTYAYPGNDGENHSKVHTYWTQAGRLFIYSLMKADGNLPLIEQ